MTKILKDVSILYVEDDEETRKFTSLVLEDYVKRIDVAQDGLKGLEMFQKNEYDVIIMDILMPNMSGIEFAKKVRESERPNIPIIITSAHTAIHYLLEVINLGINGYIIKPIEIDALIRLLERIVLPLICEQKLQKQNVLIKIISTFVSGKKYEIIKYLIDNCDENNVFYGSYDQIIQALNISKPTVVKTFHHLIEAGILLKIKNKAYKLHSGF